MRWDFGLGLFGTVGAKKWSYSVIVRYHQKSQYAVLERITPQVIVRLARNFYLQSRGRQFDSDPRLHHPRVTACVQNGTLGRRCIRYHVADGTPVRAPSQNSVASPDGEIGRHKGLKIPRALICPCRFDSGSGHQPGSLTNGASHPMCVASGGARRSRLDVATDITVR
jgi:hypothetical protein